jgi:hypothetical protein
MREGVTIIWLNRDTPIRIFTLRIGTRSSGVKRSLPRPRFVFRRPIAPLILPSPSDRTATEFPLPTEGRIRQVGLALPPALRLSGWLHYLEGFSPLTVVVTGPPPVRRMLPWRTCGHTQDLARIPIQPSSIESTLMSRQTLRGRCPCRWPHRRRPNTPEVAVVQVVRFS